MRCGKGDILSILPDKSDHLWLSTLNGIVKFNPLANEYTVYDEHFRLNCMTIIPILLIPVQKSIISYQLPVTSKVELSIFNVLGQKIATLVYNSGNYSVEWNATGLTSGVYYYQLRSDVKIVHTKKMILLK